LLGVEKAKGHPTPVTRRPVCVGSDRKFVQTSWRTRFTEWACRIAVHLAQRMISWDTLAIQNGKHVFGSAMQPATDNLVGYPWSVAAYSPQVDEGIEWQPCAGAT
jgi:hypothetical protein